MFRAEINIEKKHYINCSLFYIRKYISLRELILLAVLFVAAMLFWIGMGSILVFVMFVVTLLLMGFSVLLFIVTAYAGYSTEYKKRRIVKHFLIFNDKGFIADSYNDKNEKVFTENFAFQNIDKVAFRKDRIYIYGGVATHFYLLPDDVLEGAYEELKTFLIEKIDPKKFRMKTKYRQFPFYSKKKFEQDLQQKLDKDSMNKE
ncbi:MAG: hypothetical protein PHC84_04110 [Clostridia bacterium]|nr:hypothetical protein [Clostridia bacterium]